MRGIAMINKMWECPRCGGCASLAVKTCRKKVNGKVCGYEYLSDEIAAHEEKQKPKKKSGTRDPLISQDDEQLFVSTIKRVDE